MPLKLVAGEAEGQPVLPVRGTFDGKPVDSKETTRAFLDGVLPSSPRRVRRETAP
jgi:hypothetical protein